MTTEVLMILCVLVTAAIAVMAYRKSIQTDQDLYVTMEALQALKGDFDKRGGRLTKHDEVLDTLRCNVDGIYTRFDETKKMKRDLAKMVNKLEDQVTCHHSYVLYLHQDTPAIMTLEYGTILYRASCKHCMQDRFVEFEELSEQAQAFLVAWHKVTEPSAA